MVHIGDEIFWIRVIQDLTKPRVGVGISKSSQNFVSEQMQQAKVSCRSPRDAPSHLYASFVLNINCNAIPVLGCTCFARQLGPKPHPETKLCMHLAFQRDDQQKRCCCAELAIPALLVFVEAQLQNLGTSPIHIWHRRKQT